MTLGDRLRGVVPVLPTPFHDNGRIDVESLTHLARHTFGTGVTAVMYPGFASEHLALQAAERDALLGRLVRLARPYRVAVVGAVSEYSTDVAVWRARDIASLGVDAVNVIPSPAAHRAGDVLTLLREVALAVAPLPVVPQYVPAHMSASLAAEDFRRLAGEAGNVVAVKVESQPCADLVAALRAGTPSLPSLVGNAGVELISALRAGAVGVQPGGGFVELYVEIWRRFQAGDADAAEELFGRLRGYLDRWLDGPLTKIGKIIAARRGLVATDRCRRPEPPVSPGARRDIDRFLVEFADILRPARAASAAQQGGSA